MLSSAPVIGCVAALVAGGVLLLSGATPTDPERFRALLQRTPVVLVEASHFLSSLIGAALVLLAFGLRRRLDAAWTASVMLTAVAVLLAVLKGINLEEAAILTAVVLVLLPLRDGFDRHAGLSRIEFTPGWLLSALALLVGAALLGRWVFTHASYADEPVWEVLVDRDAERAVRATLGAGALLLGVGLWRLMASPARPPVIGDQDPDFDRVRAVLASAEDAPPEAGLALLGDKRFLFSDSGRSFLMFGVRGRSWIALGMPVGVRSEQTELIWRFRELADAYAARPAFYGIGPEDLPAVVELGFAIQKTGEFAAVPLADFSLQGRRREVLRRNWRKAKELGASFEVVTPEAVPPLIDDLQRISDHWLAGQAGGEKGFSLGGFSPRYVSEFPCALVRFEGRIVAFATLWLSSDRSAFSMDLMRYGPEGPKNIMDFLFVELLGWGREQGFKVFEFGVAPLAGLQSRPLSPLFSRIGRAVFDRGEAFYNFQGVRRYKDKYDPVWEPRYVAAPQSWMIPFVLADVSLLSAGGMAGLVKRPHKTESAAASAPRLEARQVGQVHQQDQHHGGAQKHEETPGHHAGPAAQVERPGPEPAEQGGHSGGGGQKAQGQSQVHAPI
jgi:phosphatidylglycerol lysyltransferase